MIYYENLELYLRLRLKPKKKIHRTSQWLKQYVDFNSQNKTEAEIMGTKMEKRCTNY